jgi:hypothetical protein
LGYSASGADGANAGIRYDAAYDRPPDLQGIKNPAITSDPISTTFALDDDYPYVVEATNPNGGLLHYEIQDGPAGMTIDPATGKITWRVTFAGKRTKIVVTDGKGGRVVHGYFPPIVTELVPGVPRVISEEAYSLGTAFVTIPAGVPVLQASLHNLQTSIMLRLSGKGKGSFT